MSKLSIRCWDTASQHHVCISSLVSHCSFFSPLLCLECGPRDNKALWCVCMCQREGGERQRESGAGSWVKGGADPDGAQGSWWQSGSREGVFFFGGGPGFNRDVKHDKDGPDRPGEWSCRDRAAILGIPYTALSTVVTPSAPLLLIHAPSLVVWTYFFCSSSMPWVNLMCQSLMCVSADMSRRCLRSSHQGKEKV